VSERRRVSESRTIPVSRSITKKQATIVSIACFLPILF